MYTYLAYDNKYYKIGKSKTPDKRINSMKTANPFCILLAFTQKYSESYLHEKYSKFRIKREWFEFGPELAKEVLEHFDIRPNKSFKKHKKRKLTPIVIKDKKIKTESCKAKTLKKQKEYGLKLKKEWREVGLNKMNFIIQNWDFNNLGKITAQKIWENNKISKNTVEKYYKVIKEKIKEANKNFVKSK